MSGVWREQSVPMTDRECALLALEAIGAVVSNHTETQCSLSIGGRSWMDGLGEAYARQIALKQERLARREQIATLDAERKAIQQERTTMEIERQALIETRKATVIKQAKALGYRVKETVQNGEVRLVLVKTG